MNHLVLNNETPFDRVEEKQDCPDCLGTGEIFKSSDYEEGIEGDTEECNLCLGTGSIPRQDGYNKFQDHLDEQADMVHSDNYFLHNGEEE